tara:strand:- start:164 stop:922 length:759 start_codon:yes stop_codon:yes gene_type:complete
MFNQELIQKEKDKFRRYVDSFFHGFLDLSNLEFSTGEINNEYLEVFSCRVNSFNCYPKKLGIDTRLIISNIKLSASINLQSPENSDFDFSYNVSIPENLEITEGEYIREFDQIAKQLKSKIRKKNKSHANIEIKGDTMVDKTGGYICFNFTELQNNMDRDEAFHSYFVLICSTAFKEIRITEKQISIIKRPLMDIIFAKTSDFFVDDEYSYFNLRVNMVREIVNYEQLKNEIVLSDEHFYDLKEHIMLNYSN